MKNHYQYPLLKSILRTKINDVPVWKERVRNQTHYIHLLEDVFNADISTESFSFYPNRIYFATPLTTDPEYTKSTKPAWDKIITELENIQWDVYAPFNQTDPHAKNPDQLDSYQIRDLDHIRVLQSEVALMDLNRPSHGVGQEIEMSVFMPTIGFSQVKVSRLSRGMPGLIVLNYTDHTELIGLLKEIFNRKHYKKEPFYLGNCAQHNTKSIFKGSMCLNCLFADNLQKA